MPAIASPGDLAARLELSIGELEWLADVRSWERVAPERRLRHYGYAGHPRPHGLPRPIEAPKRRLKAVQRGRTGVAEIAREEGFRVRPDKTALMTSAGRQHVCGVVVNARTNVPREDVDRLRALLHEAQLRGPAAANRDDRPDFAAHVSGRIAWVAAVNPAKGARLRAQYDRVDWRGGTPPDRPG